MDARCLIGLKWGHDEDNLHTRTAWESPLLFLQAFRCKFLAVFDDGLHVRLRPFGQLGNERHERAAYFRQAVLDLRRHGRIYFAQAFAGAMKKAYPDLPGADGLEDLAKALYK